MIFLCHLIPGFASFFIFREYSKITPYSSTSFPDTLYTSLFVTLTIECTFGVNAARVYLYLVHDIKRKGYFT